jgi:stearoyl-CoA desaturase (delta-9 desaturase)
LTRRDRRGTIDRRRLAATPPHPLDATIPIGLCWMPAYGACFFHSLSSFTRMPMNPTKPSNPAEKIDWVATVFILTYHLTLFVTLPLYLWKTSPSGELLAWTGFFVAASLISITAGYHRLFAHRTYRAKRPVEWVLLFFGTLATQSSVFRWANDHRLHHRHVDTEGDPYGTQKGFWHSHLLWMFKEGDPIEDRYISDLKEDRLLTFQHRWYGWCMAFVNLIVIAFLGLVTGDWIGAFVIGFLARVFFVHHSTWFINSLAHMWGSKPYSTEHSAVNNFILALLTYGEGYHNYHHTFAGDYRNGVRWYQFDPPKYLIWALSKVGLAWDLKRTDPLMIKKRLVQADRELLLDHLNRVVHIDVTEMKDTVHRLHEKLLATIASAKAVTDRYRAIDKHLHRSEFEEVKTRFRTLKSEISRDLRDWRRLCRQVMRLQPSPAIG